MTWGVILRYVICKRALASLTCSFDPACSVGPTIAADIAAKRREAFRVCLQSSSAIIHARSRNELPEIG